MKKVIIACLMLVSLASCSNKTEEQPVRTVSAEKTTEVTTEATTEAEIPPVTEPSIADVLYEDANCSIAYNGYKSSESAQYICLTVDNKTDNSLSARLIDLKINSKSVDEFFLQQLKANQSGSSSIFIPNSDLQAENITRVNKIELLMNITVTDKNNGDCLDYYETNSMTIER